MRTTKSQYYSQFDPRGIGGCMMWIDANDSNSFTLSGSNVTALSDKSGSGTAVTTFTGTVTWTSNGLNSRPTFDLTSGNFRGTLSSTTVASNYTHSMFCVTRLNSAAGAGSPLIVLTQPETSFTVYYRPLDYSTTGPNFRTVSFFATTAINTISAQTTSPFLWTEYYEGDQTNNSIVSLSNGANQAAALAGAAPASSPGFFSVGTEWNSVSNWNRFQWPGTVSEIIIYNNILTGEQRQLLEGYLAWKWGLQTTNLPSTHPYRFSYPFVRPFGPPDAGQCEYWFDAADTATIAATGTTLTTWSNKGTTAGSNATAGAGTVTWGAVTQQNGMDLVGMAGGAIAQVAAAFPTQTRTRFVAGRPTVNQNGGAGNEVFFVNQTTGTGRDTIVLDATNNGGRPVTVAQGVVLTMITTNQLANQSNVFGIYCFRNASATTRNRIAYNGSNMALTTNAVASGYLTTSATTQLGSNIHVGEWLSYNSQLGLVPTFQVEGYLAWKWGLQTSLPTNHIFRNVPPLSPVFTPTQISGCIAWWDAADPSVFTGGSSWTDKSGSNNTGTNGTPGASTMPSVTTWTNGNQAARFVAGSKNSVKTTNTIPNSNVTYFMVTRFQAAMASGAGYLMINNIDGQRQIFTTSTSFPVAVFAHANSSSNVQVASVNQSVPFLYSATIVTGTNGFATFTNGVANATRNTTTSSPSVNYFGSANGDSGYVTADIGEIILYNTALTPIQRQRVEGYLAWKWDLQDDLPASHPYREIKP
jgi:hypothetical protein